MLQKHETQAVRAVLGSEKHFAACSSDASEDALTPSGRQGPADSLPFSRVRVVWRPGHDRWEQVGSPAARIVNRVADMTGRARPFPTSGI